MIKKLHNPRKKPGEKQKEKLDIYMSTAKPRKGKIAGGIWPSENAPAVVYKVMMNGQWLSKAQLLEKVDKNILAKWNAMQNKERDQGNLRFWGAEKRIESAIRRISKAGDEFKQWSIEKRHDPDGLEQYRLLVGPDLASRVKS